MNALKKGEQASASEVFWDCESIGKIIMRRSENPDVTTLKKKPETVPEKFLFRALTHAEKSIHRRLPPPVY
jgi:hypothetical protein